MLASASPALAETVTSTTDSCTTTQYGGRVCGTSSSVQVTTTHDATEVKSGVNDWEMGSVIALLGISAVLATIFYKLSYRWYILG